MREENKSDWTPPSVEELAKLLKSGSEGIEKYHAMRKEHPNWKPDLSYQDFSGLDLSEANFSKVILFKADLSRANLTGVDLFEADLCEAKLLKADLSGADLGLTKLLKVNFCWAKFCGADLSRANLSGSNLSGADFSRAKTHGVNWWCAIITGVKGIRRDDAKICFATHMASIEFAD
ncbi:MAG: pentapeptide repeat-containing protein [Patescibacteria group bacterium]|nr:pentapeptide repeat-containing protein [Patescibacteria group bacterium]